MVTNEHLQAVSRLSDYYRGDDLRFAMQQRNALEDIQGKKIKSPWVRLLLMALEQFHKLNSGGGEEMLLRIKRLEKENEDLRDEIYRLEEKQSAAPTQYKELCGVTNKHIYNSAKAAGASFKGKTARLRAYRCPHCDGWHLTGTDKRIKV